MILYFIILSIGSEHSEVTGPFKISAYPERGYQMMMQLSIAMCHTLSGQTDSVSMMMVKINSIRLSGPQ